MPFANREQRRAYHREASRIWIAEERARRKAAHVCRSCRTPVVKFTECLDCRRQRATYHATVVKPKMQRLASRCVDCSHPCVRKGARRCGSCSARYANAVRWGHVQATQKRRLRTVAA